MMPIAVGLVALAVWLYVALLIERRGGDLTTIALTLIIVGLVLSHVLTAMGSPSPFAFGYLASGLALLAFIVRRGIR